MDKDPHQLGPLLERSVAGDDQAVNALLGRLRPYLHALVRRRVGPDDNVKLSQSSIVQNALLRISQHVGGLRQPTVPHLLNYAGKVVRNLMIDAFRREDHRPRADAWEEALGKSAPPTPDHLERDELAVQVAEALEKLPEKQRQVIEWRFVHDQLPYADIASRMGGSVEAVRILCFRALRRLRELMADLHPEGSSFHEEGSA